MTQENIVTLETTNQQRHFQPGATITGSAMWELRSQPERVVLSLFHYTAGKGTRDVVIDEEVVFDNPHSKDQREFSVTLPIGPYSFNGSLISVIWAMEVVVDNSEDVDRLEITVSPYEEPITLVKTESILKDGKKGGFSIE